MILQSLGGLSFLDSIENCECGKSSVGCFNKINIYFIKTNNDIPLKDLEQHKYLIKLIVVFDYINKGV
jgi:hypothetical protein